MQLVCRWQRRLLSVASVCGRPAIRMLNGQPAAAPETHSPQSRSQGLGINREDLRVPRRSEAIDQRILSDTRSASW